MSNPLKTSSNRAGTYVTQLQGYKAFIPVPLPPANPPIQIRGELQVKLSEANLALGRLDGSIQTLPNPDLFVFMYVRREAVLSSQIEGTQSSLQDVLEAEAKILAPSRQQAANEVGNYVAAMNYGLELLENIPVSVRLIRRIHARLLKDTRGSHLTPGELRTSQNWIGPVGGKLNEAIYVPPPSHEIPQHLVDLENFLHYETELPLLAKIGLAHAQFETIHPFLDGNGRVGRLLITFLLCENKVLLKPMLYLSYYFRQHRQEYYEHLQSVRDNGTWEEWLVFFLQGIVEVSEQATQTARSILSLRENDRNLINDRLGRIAGNGHRVLDYLFENPIVNVKDVQGCIGTTYESANNMVKRLEACGILRKVTEQARNRVFCYQKYILLFHDDPQVD